MESNLTLNSSKLFMNKIYLKKIKNIPLKKIVQNYKMFKFLKKEVGKLLTITKNKAAKTIMKLYKISKLNNAHRIITKHS